MQAHADQPDEPLANGQEPAGQVEVEAVIAALRDDYARLVALHRTELEDVRSAKNRQIERLRDDLADRQPRQGHEGVRPRVDDLQRHVDALQTELEGVYASETWRIGKALAFIPRRIYLWFARRGDNGSG